jgi:methyltransferase (TIGR00027 family)
VVPADLREDWGAALAAAGFDPGHPTAWLAEGLMSYLTEADREQLVERLTQLSTRGSTLALESAGAALLRSPELATEAPQALGAFVRAYQGLWRSSLPADPDAWLRPRGWQVTTEPAAAVWDRYDRPVPGPLRSDVQAAGRAWWMVAERQGPTEGGGKP